RIPLLDKDTLRTQQKLFIADTAHLLDTKIEKTSGSTGTPLTLLIDKHSQVNKYAAYARAFRWAGYRPGALRFVIKGLSETKGKPWGYDALRNMIYLNSSRMNKDVCMAAAKLVARLRPSVFEGYARSFIDFYKLTRHAYKFSSLRGIFVYGESVTPSIREFVEKAYSAHLFDFYSHAENSVMISEKPDQRKYLMEDYFYPEIVNPEGNPAEDGYGELVGTSFYNYAMPLIRYRTRDYLRLAEKQDSSFREVLEIEGRMDDHIEMPDGRKIYFAEGALGYAKGIIMAQYIQEKPGELVVSLLADDRFDTASYPEIERGLRKRIGDSLKVSFQVVDELEKKKSGKVPFIINRIGAVKLG
ncbi:MAG: hypothetical protein PHG32_06845, partial [Candidatus Cloacimonetes bacterium]|nr:hypothetical protein [Candidatus Cloacimonadota bacterium]